MQVEKRRRRGESAEFEQHAVGRLDVVLPGLREARDGGAVDDAVVGAPADGQHVRAHHVAGGVEARQLAHASDAADGHLRWQNDGHRVRAADLHARGVSRVETR